MLQREPRKSSTNEENGRDQHTHEAAQRTRYGPLRVLVERLLEHTRPRRCQGHTAERIHGDACDERGDRPGEEHERKRHDYASALRRNRKRTSAMHRDVGLT
jgi:hypothetical protein